MTLNNAKCGQKLTVTELNNSGAIKRRMMDMGITKGTTICVKKIAPLGDPIEFSVRGYSLTMRKADAEHILVS